MRRPNFIGLMTESRAFEGDAGDVGARDCEGEEGQGRALGGEEQEPEEDWVLCGVIRTRHGAVSAHICCSNWSLQSSVAVNPPFVVTISQPP
jgi:hypothetical protein